jgi:aliphatic nitrilase
MSASSDGLAASSRATANFGGLLSALGLALAARSHRLWQAYWDHKARRATVLMLEALDDRMLKDIGLYRSEIRPIVLGNNPERRRPYDLHWYKLPELSGRRCSPNASRKQLTFCLGRLPVTFPPTLGVLADGAMHPSAGGWAAASAGQPMASSASLRRTPVSPIVKAAAVQISPVLYSRQGTIEKIARKIRELGKQNVQFATFPETVVPYYPYFSFVQPAFALGKEHLRLLEQAVTVPSAETRAIGEAAKDARMVVSIGVNERDGGSIYNTQLLFDADGALIQRRRKIMPTHHERMIWGQGDGSGLRAVDSAVGRIGQLACWEHYLPLARYALIADGEQIHSAMYPGSIFGQLFSEQTEANIRQHALESACFVVCATAWLDADQQARIMKDTGCAVGPISGGCFTAIASPDGRIIGGPLQVGEGAVIADLDLLQIDARKRLMDARGHYNRPELLSLSIDRTHASPIHERATRPHAERPPAADAVEERRAETLPNRAIGPMGAQ